MQKEVNKKILDDKSFILKTMINGYRHSFETMSIKETYYKDTFTPIFQKIFNNSDIHVEKTKEGIIKSFIVYKGDLLHWVYVKNYLRGQGKGTGLINKFFDKDKPLYISFLTKDFLNHCYNKFKIEYQPFTRYGV